MLFMPNRAHLYVTKKVVLAVKYIPVYPLNLPIER